MYRIRIAQAVDLYILYIWYFSIKTNKIISSTARRSARNYDLNDVKKKMSKL